MHLGRQDIVHLIVEQVTAFLAHGDELPYLIVFFLKSQTHASPSKTQSRRRADIHGKAAGLDTPAHFEINFVKTDE